MLSEYSVKKPFTVVVAIVLVLILGFVSYTKMTVDLIPSINLPYAVVITTYPGASPEQVETVVTDTLEQTLASVDNMDQLTSISAENMSIIILEFNDDTNMDSAVLEMRESLDMITPYFPDEIGSPMIMKINPDMMPVEILTASVDGMNDDEAAAYIEEKIIPEIKSVEGVASATATGLIENFVDVTICEDKINSVNDNINAYIQEQIDKAIDEQVESILEEQLAAAKEQAQSIDISALTPELLAQYQSMQGSAPEINEDEMRSQIRQQVEEAMKNSDDAPSADTDISSNITVDMISGILSAQNFSMPAGSVDDNEGISHLLRVGDKYESAEELGNQILFEIDGYGQVKLSDVADIYTYDNTSMIYSKINGNHAVMLALQKQPNYSTAEVTNAVQDKIDEITADNSNVKFNILMNQGEYVNLMIDSIVKNLLLGALFAIVILYIFLRKFRPTIIVAASIAISVVTTFVLMYFAGITLNMISMGGLALGVGMLVDNSIVVIENIFRMRAEGKTRKEAAIEGAKQVAGAITSSTITTIVVFVPIAFTSGITKQLFVDMALTIGFSLAASLVVALTLVPTASAAWIGDNVTFKKNFSDNLSEAYGKMIDKVLNHKWIVIVAVVVLLGGGIAAALSSGTQLFPSMDTGSITVSVDIPETYSREQRFDALDKLNDTLLSVDGVETVGIMDTTESTDAGSSLMSLSSSGTTVYVMLDESRTSTTDEIIENIRDLTADYDYTVTVSNSNMDLSMLSGDSVSIKIMGRELDDIREAARQVADVVSSVDGTVDVDSGVTESKEEIRVVVDKNAAMLKGLTTAQVYTAVSDAAADAKSSLSYTENGISYSVYIKDGRENKFISDDVKDITLTAADGTEVPITDVADVITADGFTSITHNNQERTVTVKASLKDGFDVTKVNNEIADKLENITLPSGCRYEMSGESETIKDTFSDLFLMLALAIVFIYLVMVAQFQSFLFPFIVMFTIPLAFTGGFWALFITGTPVSVITLIGLVVLVGIVVNNGIVFVDYANQLIACGMPTRDALIKTGKDRLRPILMTALTTIIALLGMAFDTSMGSEMLKPIAITTIGGMLYSTLLTLVFIPVMYSILRKDKKKAE